MLGNDIDPYWAYCIDEAAAYLLGQKHPPRYGRQGGSAAGGQSLNQNPKLLAELARMGGAKVQR